MSYKDILTTLKAKVNMHVRNFDQFFKLSSRIRVDLLSCESKLTDKREQYDWKAGKKLDGIYRGFSPAWLLQLEEEKI